MYNPMITRLNREEICMILIEFISKKLAMHQIIRPRNLSAFGRADRHRPDVGHLKYIRSSNRRHISLSMQSPSRSDIELQCIWLLAYRAPSVFVSASVNLPRQ